MTSNHTGRVPFYPNREMKNTGILKYNKVDTNDKTVITM